jgi:hypothetical protein
MSALALYWKPLSRPTNHATGHAAHLREASLLQDLRGGDTAVAAPADCNDFSRGIQFMQSSREVPQRNMNCTWDISLTQLIWITDINDHCSSLLLRPRFFRCYFYNGWPTKKIAKHYLPFLLFIYRLLLRFITFV